VSLVSISSDFLLYCDMSQQHMKNRLTHWLMNLLLASGVYVYALAFVPEEDILSTCCNKDGVT